MVSRQAYYKSVRQQQQQGAQQALVIELVQRIRRTNKRMGGKKLYSLLRTDIGQLGCLMGRDKFFELLAKSDLLIKRQRKYARTTESNHRFRRYGNSLAQFTASAPHQAWVCDITYVRVQKGFVYLFLITDAFSRKIVGWELSESLGLQGALKSLSMALGQCPAGREVIHHSDRGFQYCSGPYVKRLQQRGMRISMAEAGNCYENAMAERMNGILKSEYGLDETFTDVKQARKVTAQGIKSYNEQRPHWSLQLKIPAQVHTA
jgi:putative transposase